MAAGNFQWYHSFKGLMGQTGALFTGTGADTFYIDLLSSSYTPDLANHADTGDLTGALGSPGPVTLTGVTWTVSSGTWTLDFNDGVFDYGTSTTAKYAVVYRDSDNALVGYWELDTGTTVTATKITCQINASGAGTLS